MTQDGILLNDAHIPSSLAIPRVQTINVRRLQLQMAADAHCCFVLLAEGGGGALYVSLERRK